MSNLRKTLAGVLACAAGIALLANVASATPAMHALALKNAAPNAVETVRWGGWHGGWHGGWRGGGGWGWGGFAAGAIIGGALAAPYYYGGYYPYGPYYAPPPPGYYGGYGGPAGGDATAYCAQRYKSYDPSTGTFLGYDGARHPCP
jgi:hypothetical protein